MAAALTFGLIGHLSLTSSAEAAIGTVDQVPATTILIPYFEVDLVNTNGRTTQVSLSNTSATATLHNVVLWSDAGVPVFNFNVYLTGYDTQVFDMRDILNGTLPRTASAGQDPSDTISNHGNVSQDINFASCSSFLPPAGVSAATVNDLRAMLTGLASTVAYPGQCVGFNNGDNVARGYLTIDTTTQCTTDTPATPGYFSTSVASLQNTQVAEYMLIDRSTNQMTIDNGVAVEGSTTDASVNVSGQYTFYSRLIGSDASDRREALASTWGVQGDNHSGKVLVWRDVKAAPAAFACNSTPSYAPLGQEQIVFLTPDSEPTISTTPGVGRATQVTPMTAAALGAPAAAKQGWTFMNLNTTLGGVTVPTEDPAAAQSYITVVRTLEDTSRATTSSMAVQLDSAGDSSHFTLGN
ncbi:hypothetical protein C7S18_01455 [Ahniella affigens]|uniref:Uncharacterized protein n=1 Tax=Ahniella affigens TaxID=2021234 RepID=A0A2P1PM74_9GAMM|nr:hypothetical protein C7S18_01455 [Ahniella affigens]